MAKTAKAPESEGAIKAEEVVLADLVPAKRNPNVMRPEHRELLKASIRRGGFLQPILIGREGGQLHIIDGHHRVEVLRELGHTKAGALVMENVPESRREAIALGMNRLRGEIDLLTASEMVADLVKVGFAPEDLVVTGFSAEDIAEFARMRTEVGTLPNVPNDTGGSGGDGAERAKKWELKVQFTEELPYRKVLAFLREKSGRGADLDVGLLKLADESKEAKKEEARGKASKDKSGGKEAPQAKAGTRKAPRK